MEARRRIEEHAGALTRAERRVAEVVLSRPQVVGFGTVAELAGAAGTGAATVVRLAAKLGFSGFTDLQASIRDDLARQLRPAAERIHESPGHPFEQHRAAALANVAATLDGADPQTCDAVVSLLADLARPVLVMAGDAARGVALQFTTDLLSLRPGVESVDGNEVAVRRRIAFADDGGVLVAIDLRRHDRWLLETVHAAVERGLVAVAVTDDLLSPLARAAAHTLVVSAASVSPFDSHVGTLALLDLLVASVADRIRPSAADRLARAEQAWRRADSLTDP